MAAAYAGRAVGAAANAARASWAQDIADVLWGSGAASGGYTLAAMYQECSNGLTTIDAANSRVTDFAVLPCSGSTWVLGRASRLPRLAVRVPALPLFCTGGEPAAGQPRDTPEC